MGHSLKSKYVFVGGTGRCGTNLLRELLSNHDEVASLHFEHRFLIDPDGIVDFLNTYHNSWSPFIADTRLKRLSTFLYRLTKAGSNNAKYQDWELEKWFPGFEKEVITLLDRLIDFKYAGTWPGISQQDRDGTIWYATPSKKESLTETLGGFSRAVINKFLASKGKEVYVEDNTWNIMFAPEISELFPNAIFIHMYRDPRDVILSFMEQRWCPNQLDQATRFFMDISQKNWTNAAGLSEDRLINVKYEDLLAETESVTKRICKITGLSHPFEHDIQIDENNVGKFRLKMSADQRTYLDTQLGTLIEELGYERA